MKVLITARLPKEILDMVMKKHKVIINPQASPMERDDLLFRIWDKDALLCTITDRIDREVIESAPGLRIIANYGVGHDNIDLEFATSKGIAVTNTPGVLTETTADLTFALILAVCRRVVEGDRMTRQGRFRFWAPMHFLGTDVTGKTLGIVGLGRIGEAVARRAAAFNMKVIYHGRARADEKREKELGVEYRSLDDLLENADIVSVHVPLTPRTRHLIGERQLARMKPTSFLINTARGPVVDETALLKALRENLVAGAGLDVYENEPELTPGLTDLDNVVLLPHMGSATIETRTRMAKMAAENLLTGLDGKIPPNCLNREGLCDTEQSFFQHEFPIREDLGISL